MLFVVSGYLVALTYVGHALINITNGVLMTLYYVGHVLSNVINIPYTTWSASDTLSSLVLRGARDDQCY